MLQTMSLRMTVPSLRPCPFGTCRDRETRAARNSSVGLQALGKPEVAVQARVQETGDLDNPSVAESQQVEGAEPELVVAVFALVAGERRLRVGVDRHQPPRGLEQPFAQE